MNLDAVTGSLVELRDICLHQVQCNLTGIVCRNQHRIQVDGITAQALVGNNLTDADGVLVGNPDLGQRAVIHALRSSSHQRVRNPALGKGKICDGQFHGPDTGILRSCGVHRDVALQHQQILLVIFFDLNVGGVDSEVGCSDTEHSGSIRLWPWLRPCHTS